MGQGQIMLFLGQNKLLSREQQSKLRKLSRRQNLQKYMIGSIDNYSCLRFAIFAGFCCCFWLTTPKITSPFDSILTTVTGSLTLLDKTLSITGHFVRFLISIRHRIHSVSLLYNGIHPTLPFMTSSRLLFDNRCSQFDNIHT